MTDLEQELEEAQRLLASYQDLAVDQEDDDAFVAGGNARLEAVGLQLVDGVCG